ncbi:MAG TPA: hypothetical protein VMI73_18565 [Trebonia sp.]|nr:hypothetical protein [Trebonia sp.]
MIAPRPASGADELPLSALLSQTLVAFTIEADNEAEHRIPHRTTDHETSAHGGGLCRGNYAAPAAPRPPPPSPRCRR